MESEREGRRNQETEKIVDLVFVGERIEVGLKRGKFDHPALMNGKPGANREDENEEGTHVVATIPTWPTFPPAQQCHYQLISTLLITHHPTIHKGHP